MKTSCPLSTDYARFQIHSLDIFSINQLFKVTAKALKK